EAFAKYPALKEKISFLKEQYDAAQNKTMDIVRSEIEYNKKKASEKSEEELRKIADEKEVANVAMLDAKTALAQASDELEGKLLTNIVDVKHHVYTHVTVQYGSDKILTKKEHGQTVFSYNQHEIQARATMVGDDIAKEQE
ncbi:FapA family protein, partial [Ancylomarina longa]